jgi:hypothetical protein
VTIALVQPTAISVTCGVWQIVTSTGTDTAIARPSVSLSTDALVILSRRSYTTTRVDLIQRLSDSGGTPHQSIAFVLPQGCFWRSRAESTLGSQIDERHLFQPLMPQAADAQPTDTLGRHLASATPRVLGLG